MIAFPRVPTATRARFTALAAAASASILASTLLVAAFGDEQAAPPSAEGTLSPGRVFAERTGESLYANVCGGCHMADGRGAVGAGAYPSLANNGKLAAAGYPILVVVQGLRGMPAVGRRMSDEQVAVVVNYVRTHFGNGYGDAVSAADVKAARS